MCVCLSLFVWMDVCIRHARVCVIYMCICVCQNAGTVAACACEGTGRQTKRACHHPFLPERRRHTNTYTHTPTHAHTVSFLLPLSHQNTHPSTHTPSQVTDSKGAEVGQGVICLRHAFPTASRSSRTGAVQVCVCM